MIQILSTHEAGIRELQVSKSLSQKKKLERVGLVMENL